MISNFVTFGLLAFLPVARENVQSIPTVSKDSIIVGQHLPALSA